MVIRHMQFYFRIALVRMKKGFSCSDGVHRYVELQKIPFSPKQTILSVFTEVRKTKTLRRLELPLLEHTDYNKYNDRNKVRRHLEKLLIAHAEIRNIVVDDEKSAEQD